MTQIFHAIPYPLSPSYFYARLPQGYKASRAPGFLTAEGTLLFGPEAENYGEDGNSAKDSRWLAPLAPRALIGDVVYEGQLVVPVWRRVEHRFLGVLSALGIWLYLDLPQYVTPTPGIAPMMVTSAWLDRLFPEAAANAAAAAAPPAAGDIDFNTHTWQWAFFLVHVAKVVLLFLIISSGVFNPISLNPLAHRALRRSPPDVARMKKFGPTGDRKASIAEWRLEHARTAIKAAGGIGAAATAPAYLAELRSAGVVLGPGEGWATSRERFLLPPSEKDEPTTRGRFFLSVEYYRDCYNYLRPILDNANASFTDREDELAHFRRYGPREGSKELKAYYTERKAAELQELAVKEKEKERARFMD